MYSPGKNLNCYFALSLSCDSAMRAGRRALPAKSADVAVKTKIDFEFEFERSNFAGRALSSAAVRHGGAADWHWDMYAVSMSGRPEAAKPSKNVDMSCCCALLGRERSRCAVSGIPLLSAGNGLHSVCADHNNHGASS